MTFENLHVKYHKMTKMIIVKLKLAKKLFCVSNKQKFVYLAIIVKLYLA